MDAELRKSIASTTNVRRTLAALAIAGIALIGRPAQAATISAPFVTVNNGDTFTVGIAIVDAVDLIAWQFDLAFDPAIVEATAVAEGPFFSMFSPLGFTSFTPGVTDNTSGLISLAFGSYDDLAPYPSGDGVLATIEFHALAEGVSPLTSSNAFLNFSGQGFAASNGQITVLGPDDGGNGGGGGGGSTPVPEPGTLILLFTGVGAIASRSRSWRLRVLKSKDAKHLVVAMALAVAGSMTTSAPAAAQLQFPPLGDLTELPVLEPIAIYPPTVATSAAGPFFPIPSRAQSLVPNQRFVILTNFNRDAVLDRETGLVWARRAVSNGGDRQMTWFAADENCRNLTVGSRRGWRLPAAADLMTLIDPSRITNSVKFPEGHPFLLFTDSLFDRFLFWTIGDYNPLDTLSKAAVVIDLGTGRDIGAARIDSDGYQALCVRGRR